MFFSAKHNQLEIINLNNEINFKLQIKYPRQNENIFHKDRFLAKILNLFLKGFITTTIIDKS